jgi:hypothetical protein
MSQTDYSFSLMLLERDSKHLSAMARKELEQSGTVPTKDALRAMYQIKRDAQGKKPVALVVGASRGIGRQVAIDLANNGYAGMSSRFPHFIIHRADPS